MYLGEEKDEEKCNLSPTTMLGGKNLRNCKPTYDLLVHLFFKEVAESALSVCSLK